MVIKALAALVVLGYSLSLYTPATSLAIPERYQFVIQATGWQPHEVPLLAAVVECESSWRTDAVGAAGELGMLQFVPETWAYINADPPDGLGSGAPPAWEAWTWPHTQFYQARQLYLEQGFWPWTCAWPYL